MNWCEVFGYGLPSAEAGVDQRELEGRHESSQAVASSAVEACRCLEYVDRPGNVRGVERCAAEDIQILKAVRRGRRVLHGVAKNLSRSRRLSPLYQQRRERDSAIITAICVLRSE